MPIRLIILITILVSIILGVIEVLVSKNRKRSLIINGTLFVAILLFLFLHGPLFVLSPIKIGYSTLKEDKLTIYYPNDIDSEDLEDFWLVIDDARDNVLEVYENEVDEVYVLIESAKDMMFLAGVPVEEAKGSSTSEAVYLRIDGVDVGILTHELSHYYLQKSSGRSSLYFPRWFDEGLATYLDGSESLEKFTRYEVLEGSIENGRYEQELEYWDGIRGMYRWLFKDCKNRPHEAYTQSYFLVRYLSDEYGTELISELVEKSSDFKTFDDLFEEVYEMSVDEFHENFLQDYERYDLLEDVRPGLEGNMQNVVLVGKPVFPKNIY